MTSVKKAYGTAKRRRISLDLHTNIMKTVKPANAMPANFIHSIDALIVYIIYEKLISRDTPFRCSINVNHLKIITLSDIIITMILLYLFIINSSKAGIDYVIE